MRLLSVVTESCLVAVHRASGEGRQIVPAYHLLCSCFVRVAEVYCTNLARSPCSAPTTPRYSWRPIGAQRRPMAAFLAIGALSRPRTPASRLRPPLWLLSLSIPKGAKLSK
jgi:hypothetical protein